jgi:hypothetical protein
MTDVAFITTCKGRLHHLQQTLPLMVAASPAEIVVVDYGCPQGTGDWVAAHHPDVSVVRVNDDPGFCASRARNLGARKTTASWLAFIDADVKVAPEWTRWMAGHLRAGHYYRAGRVDGERVEDTWGTVLCSRQGFAKIGGYDEVFRGWGGEDDDLYARLRMAGEIESEYPPHFVEAIGHADEERTRFHDVQDKDLQAMVNRFYFEAKLDLMKLIGQELPFVQRQAMMQKIRETLLAWNEDPASRSAGFNTNFALPAWLPGPFRMVKHYTISLNLQPLEQTRPPADRPEPG